MTRLALVLLFAPSISNAATLQVGEGQTYASINDALDDAVSGDTIEVSAGTYEEDVTVTIDLTLTGVDGSGSTVLLGSDTTLTVADATVEVSGFTLYSDGDRGFSFEEAVVTGSDLSVAAISSSDNGAGGRIIAGSEVYLSDVVFNSNEADEAGGHLLITDSEVTISDTTFSSGEAENGGAVYVSDSSLTLESVELSDNTASNGWSSAYGGAIVASATTLTIEGSTFEDNYVDGYGSGGQIYATDSTVTLSVSLFSGGQASYYGAAMYLVDSNLELDGSSFSDNAVSSEDYGRGGAILLDATSATMANAYFSDNSAGNDGGAVYFDGNGDLAISNVTFTNSSADDDGGALYVSDDTGPISIDDSTFSGNVCGDLGGAIMIMGSGRSLEVDGSDFDSNEAGEDGGGIYSSDSMELAVSDSTFTSNVSSSTGGAINSTDYATLNIDSVEFEGNYSQYGAAVYHRERGELVIRDSTFSANEGEYAAALRWYGDSGSARASIESNTFTNNAVSSWGGAIGAYDGGFLSFVDNEFSGNSAGEEGGAIYVDEVDDVEAVGNLFCANESYGADGGAVYAIADANSGSATFTNNLFIENYSADDGGGLFLYGDANGVVRNNDFLGNEAADNGGGLYVNMDDLQVSNNISAWTVSGTGVYANDNADTPRVEYSDWYDNSPADASGALDDGIIALGDGNILVDPDLQDYTLNGDCSDDNYWLSWGSDLIDAGDPNLSDPDGSRSDIGAFGGEDADEDAWEDADEDAYPVMWDCDDENGDMNPGNEEVPYDGIDNDCDGEDECDVDGDGYAYSGDACGGEDCDDASDGVYPGAADVWYDGVDADCDGANDYDADGDGYESDAYDGDDCDDANVDVSPGAAEVWYDGVDTDCGGDSDYDADGDGHDSDAYDGDDCDDDDADISPTSAETWYDGVDSDCDGANDYDADGDGYDSDAYEGEDCDDDDASISPAATEILGDGIDQDCDGYDLTEDGNVEVEIEDTGEYAASDKLNVDGGSCGCAAGATPIGSAIWMAVFALAGLRRRGSA